MTKAADVMSPQIVSLTPDMPVRAALVLLLEYGFTALPVVDASVTGVDARVVGIVSERDLLAAGVRGSDDDVGGSGAGMTVADLITVPTVTMPLTATTTELAATMLAGGMNSVAIVDNDGHLVGIVGRIDLQRPHGTRRRQGHRPATSGAAYLHRVEDPV
jgi:CBS domain-containing membrane protein